jgi:hypothetical protein
VRIYHFSRSDEITGRGLESVFKVTATATVLGRAQVNYALAIAEASGTKMDKIAKQRRRLHAGNTTHHRPLLAD